MTQGNLIFMVPLADNPCILAHNCNFMSLGTTKGIIVSRTKSVLASSLASFSGMMLVASIVVVVE